METEIEKLKQLRADREKMKQRQETTLVTREKGEAGRKRCDGDSLSGVREQAARS